MPKTVHILNHNRNGIEVHKPDCAHIARAKKTGMWSNDWPVALPDGVAIAEGAVADLNASFGWHPGDEDSPPWATSDITVMPCTKEVK